MQDWPTIKFNVNVIFFKFPSYFVKRWINQVVISFSILELHIDSLDLKFSRKSQYPLHKLKYFTCTINKEFLTVIK